MYKVKAKLASKELKETDFVGSPFREEELHNLTEGIVFPVEYNEKSYLALYDDIKKDLIVFDMED